MNTGPLPELSNLLDSDVLTCFLIFWLYHTQSIIQSAGTKRNTGAQSISSWQTFAFASKVGVLGKESTWLYLAFKSQNFCKALDLFLWNVQRKTWVHRSTAWTTQIYCRTRSHHGHWASSVRIQTQGKCMYCSLQASLSPGCFLFSCIAVKTFSMWTSFSAACSASTCTILCVLRGMVGFLKNRAKWTHLVSSVVQE